MLFVTKTFVMLFYKNANGWISVPLNLLEKCTNKRTESVKHYLQRKLYDGCCRQYLWVCLKAFVQYYLSLFYDYQFPYFTKLKSFCWVCYIKCACRNLESQEMYIVLAVISKMPLFDIRWPKMTPFETSDTDFHILMVMLRELRCEELYLQIVRWEYIIQEV